MNDEKSVCEPTQIVVFLGTILNFKDGTIHIPERRIAKLKTSLSACLKHRSVMARDLASITGQIISMLCAVGNISRLLTRSCYAAIECRESWEQLVLISPSIRTELSFWHDNIDSINGRPMSPKSSAVAIVYSDASDSKTDATNTYLSKASASVTCLRNSVFNNTMRTYMSSPDIDTNFPKKNRRR